MVQGKGDRRHRFDVLFDAYKSDVTAYCGWRTTSPSDADDAVADVFLVAWRRLDDVPAGDGARAWLYATARRVLANQRRSRRRLETLRERLGHEPHVWPPVPAPALPEAALVHEALAKLSPRDREVLLLAEWEGLTPTEMAEVLGCLVVTARGRLHRARRRFRDVFEATAPRDGRVNAVDLASDVASTFRKAHT